MYRTNAASERLRILGTVGKREREDARGVPERAGAHMLPGAWVEKIGGGIEEEEGRAGKDVGIKFMSKTFNALLSKKL